ncbi:MAG TPA: hypothetical protein GXX42_14780 [Petrimonas sp.]|uniref:hypothetical protein n=1 Tax=Petrimonas sp. TaxID=2023866 RepID=UPI0009611EB8|nr:MAG: hypothetical protein BGO33_07705 [Bacteroidia bacterium 43-41]HHV87050.1 hypothetical protein [Petrimonas sp.]
MSGFVLKEIEEIKGSKYDFYKLEIDGNCAFDEFENKICSNKQHLSEFTTLLSYAQHYANGERIPDKKLKPIYLKIKDVSTFEFRSKHLRIYFFCTSSNPDRIIALCGYKNRQKSDISSLTSIVKRYLID